MIQPFLVFVDLQNVIALNQNLSIVHSKMQKSVGKKQKNIHILDGLNLKAKKKAIYIVKE